MYVCILNISYKNKSRIGLVYSNGDMKKRQNERISKNRHNNDYKKVFLKEAYM